MTDNEVRIVSGDRVVFARPRDRVRRIEIDRRPLYAHPAVAILIAGVVILPFSLAMMVLMLRDDAAAFVRTLVIGFGAAAVVSACVLGGLARWRRRAGWWRVVITAGDRRYSFAVHQDDEPAVRRLVERESGAMGRPDRG